MVVESVVTYPKQRRTSFAAVAVDRIWRFFCSVRAALYEIVFLALLVLIGTLKGVSSPPSCRASFPRWNRS